MVAASTVPFFPTATPLPIDNDGNFILPSPVDVKPLSEARQRELGILDCPVEDIPWISNGEDVSSNAFTRQSKEVTLSVAYNENAIDQVGRIVSGNGNRRDNSNANSNGVSQDSMELDQSDLDDVAVALERRFNNKILKYGKFKVQFDEGELGLLLHRRIPGSCGLRVKKIYDDGQACKFKEIQVNDFAVGLNGKDIRFLSDLRKATGKREITFIRINDPEMQQPIQTGENSTNPMEKTVHPVRPLGDSDNDQNIDISSQSRTLAINVTDQNDFDTTGQPSVSDEPTYRGVRKELCPNGDTIHDSNVRESTTHAVDDVNCRQSVIPREQPRDEPDPAGFEMRQAANDLLLGLASQGTASRKSEESSPSSAELEFVEMACRSDLDAALTRFCDNQAAIENADKVLRYLMRNTSKVNWKRFSILGSRFLHKHTNCAKEDTHCRFGRLLSIIPQAPPRSSDDCKVTQSVLEACANSEGTVQDDLIECIKTRVLLTSDKTYCSILGFLLRYELALSILKFCPSTDFSSTFAQMLAIFRGSPPESLAADFMGLGSVDSSARQIVEAVLRVVSENPNENVLHVAGACVNTMIMMKPINKDIVFAAMELLETLEGDGCEQIFQEFHPAIVEILANDISKRRTYFATGGYYAKAIKFLFHDQGVMLSRWVVRVDTSTAEKFWRACVHFSGKSNFPSGGLDSKDCTLKSLGKKVLERKHRYLRDVGASQKDLAEKSLSVQHWPVDPTAKFEKLPQEIRTFIFSDQRSKFVYCHKQGTSHSQWLCKMSKPGFTVELGDSEDSVVVTKTKHNDLLELIRRQTAINKYSQIQHDIQKVEAELEELQHANGNGRKSTLDLAPAEAADVAELSPSARMSGRYAVEFQPGKIGLRFHQKRVLYGFVVVDVEAGGQASNKMVKSGDIAHKLNGKIIISDGDIAKSEAVARTIEFLRLPNTPSRVRLAAPVPIAAKRPLKRARVTAETPVGTEVITIDD